MQQTRGSYLSGVRDEYEFPWDYGGQISLNNGVEIFCVALQILFVLKEKVAGQMSLPESGGGAGQFKCHLG